jgi:UDP-N-acetylglucosamine 2-epimerase (non-hydrolysing)
VFHDFKYLNKNPKSIPYMYPKNSVKKILLVFGTRPEAIKMAPLVKAFKRFPENFETLVCVTAQHREMLDQVLNLFDIKPDYDLNIMKKSQDLYDVTSDVLMGMRDVLKDANPDLVLVHGDTSTSTAASLAAFYKKIPVGHIEAGLRTNDRYNPWPEEMNRQITGRIATFHFSPTRLSKQNLMEEGIQEKYIYITGNTVIDSLYWVLNKIDKDKNLEQIIKSQLGKAGVPIEKITAWHNQLNPTIISTEEKYKFVKQRKLVLITGHRRENFGEKFVNICESIKELAEKYPDVDFVYPMHLNPNVRDAIKHVFGKTIFSDKYEKSDLGSSNMVFTEPLDYLPFVYLMNISYLVLTDSGGIQEEAPGLGKPVLVMRDTTERPEAVEAGTVSLVGTNKDIIIEAVSNLLELNEDYIKMSKANNPYGDGKACDYIVSNVLNFL